MPNKSSREVKLPRSTVVYSLIGTNCFNRTEAAQSHRHFPAHSRLRFFPGNHDWARAEYLTAGLAELYGQALRARGREPEFAGHRRLYSAAMSGYMDGLIADQPWEAARWASFLSDFPDAGTAGEHAQQALAKLERDEKVQRAREAEKEMVGLVEKPNAQLAAAALKLAEKYAGLPYAEIFSLLAKPVK